MKSTDIFDILSRDAIGLLNSFDRLHNVNNTSFPPHNIVKVDNTTYRVELAVAGYSENDIVVTVEDNKLVITGVRKDSSTVAYLHRGVAFRDFRKEFVLSEDIEVGDAALTNGLLSVTLKHVIPESKKPKKITIKSTD